MAARRLILSMLVLLVLSSILAALVPVERDRLAGDSSTTTSTDTTAAAPVATGDLVERTVKVSDATPDRIELRLGDQLDLTVTSDQVSDLVEIPAFGALDNVDPDFPAHFDLLALEQGRFAVRLVDTGRVIANIDVGPGRDQAQGSGDAEGAGRGSDSRGSGNSKDSPGSNTDNSTPGASSLS